MSSVEGLSLLSAVPGPVSVITAGITQISRLCLSKRASLALAGPKGLKISRNTRTARPIVCNLHRSSCSFGRFFPSRFLVDFRGLDFSESTCICGPYPLFIFRITCYLVRKVFLYSIPTSVGFIRDSNELVAFTQCLQRIVNKCEALEIVFSSK